MSDIATLLNAIKTAIYGRDVRQAIHDAIRKCYDDGRAGSIDLTARELAKLNAGKLQAEITEFTESATGRMDDYETQTSTQIAEELAAVKACGVYIFFLIGDNFHSGGGIICTGQLTQI